MLQIVRPGGFADEFTGAEEIFRVPAEGSAFYLDLRIGDTDLGLVAEADPGTGEVSRILLSIGVDDVDETLGRVTALGGSSVAAPTTCRGDSASPTSRTPTETR